MGDEDEGEQLWGLQTEDGLYAYVKGLAINLESSALPDRTDREVTRSYAEQAFPREFARWIDNFSTYLEIWTTQGVQNFVAFRTLGPMLVLFDHNSDFGFESQVSPDRPTRSALAELSIEHQFASLSQLRSSARLVSEGATPDVAWLMLNQARKFASVEPRYAVIQACSAVEVALGKKISDTLFGYPVDARNEILKGAGGLVGLAKLHDKLFPRPADIKRPDFSNQIANLRNRVAHMGYEPEPQQVSTALSAARRLLDEFSPVVQPDRD